MPDSKASVPWHLASVVATVSFFIAIAVLLFSSAISAENHDEDIYILGARFFADHMIYKDYLYHQPPYHPALLGSIYQLSNDMFGVCKRPCYFFMARMLNWLVALGVMVIFYLLLRTMFERRVAIVCCTLLALTSRFFLAAGVVRNDLMPMLLSLLAVFVLFRPIEAGMSRRWRALVAGVCIALAVGTKLNYIHMLPVLFLFLALWPPQLALGERLREQIVPFSSGALLGLMPVALLAARDPAAFYFGLYGYHSSPAPEWLAKNLHGNTPLKMFSNVLMNPPTSVLIALVFLLMLLIGFHRSAGRPLAYFYGNGQWLFFLILVAAIYVGLQPSPSYGWYSLPATPFLILCFASLWSYPMRKDLAHPVALVIAVLACVPNLIGIASSPLQRVVNPPKWRPVLTHAISARVDEILDEANVQGKIATLSPSTIIDSKRDFYLELANAWGFFPRAAFMPDDEVLRLHTASPATLTGILEADMPAAILGGYEPEAGDAILFAFAEAHGYRLVHDKALRKGILFVRPPQVSPEP